MTTYGIKKTSFHDFLRPNFPKSYYKACFKNITLFLRIFRRNNDLFLKKQYSKIHVFLPITRNKLEKHSINNLTRKRRQISA